MIYSPKTKDEKHKMEVKELARPKDSDGDSNFDLI